MAKKQTEEQQGIVSTPKLTVSIPELQISTVKFRLGGMPDSSLISHKWSEKARKQIQDSGRGKAKVKSMPDPPEVEYKASLYEIPGKPGRYGFPASGLKQAIVSACRFIEGVPMTIARGALFVCGDYLEIDDADPQMRNDFVRVGGKGPGTGSPSPRYRGEFVGWTATVTIRFNANVITPQQIGCLLQHAGFSVGLGDWRPERGGSHGQFEVIANKKAA